MIGNDEFLSSSSSRHLMDFAKIILQEIEEQKVNASPEETIILKERHDYYIDMMKNLMKIIDIYGEINKIKNSYPDNYSDSMTSHGIEYIRLYHQVKELSSTVIAEYKKRHHVS